MKKLVQTAELYVEWVALALGGVFLLLMMFLYLLSTPVSKELGTNKVTLSDVDHVIYEAQAKLLDEAMSKNVEVSLAVKPFAAAFTETLAMKEAKPLLIADDRRWIGIPAAPAIIIRDDTKLPVTQALVNRLPEPLPAPEWHSASTGRSVIPVAIVPGAVVAPISAFAPIPVAGQGLPLGIDKLWVTEAFSIPTQKIADAFAASQIPAGLPTAILALELIREEQLPDGQWGHRALIKPLATPQMVAFPAEGNLTEETNYLDWATRNTSTLTLPIFHVVVAGEKWYPPGQPNPNLPGAVDPTRPVTPSPGSGFPVPRSGNRRRPLPAAADPRPAAFDMYAQAAPSPWPPTGSMPPGYPPAPLPGGGYQDPSMTGQVVGGPTSAVPAGFTVPNGNFVPSDLKKNIFVWAHDDTVEPEKVYRYKLRYRLKSPVYRSNAADPKQARQFSLLSTESDWSEAVVVPPVVYVFLASGVSTNTTSAKFDVLRWQNGKWHKKSFTAEPGDIIGGEAQDTGMDFTTGYSLVDMKLDVVTRDPKVVLSNRTGELSTRSFRVDQSEIITIQKQVGYTDPILVPKTGPPGGPGTYPPSGPGAYPGGPGQMYPR